MISFNMRAPKVTRFGLATALLAGLGVGATSAAAQDAPEPLLEQVRTVFDHPGLKVGFLIQAVMDPGLDGESASAGVAAARLRVLGRLDRGFDYLLQTNFAASPALLDARVGWSRSNAFHVSAGRFKAPFSRELLTYAGAIDFVNRSRVVDALSPNRQMGLQVGGAVGEHVLWTAGGFTGSRAPTVNESLQGVIRLEGAAMELGGGTLSTAAHVGVGRDAAMAGRAMPSSFWGLDGRWEADRLLLAFEVIGAEWNSVGEPESDASGHYATVGWMVGSASQLLARWDRYRAPSAVVADDQVVLGYNVWPTSAAEVQVNWLLPVNGSAAPHQLVVNFQVGL